MLAAAVTTLIVVGIINFLVLVYSLNLTQETRNEQLKIMGDLHSIQAYVEGTHHLCLELQILTPKGKKAAKDFMGFTTATYTPFQQ